MRIRLAAVGILMSALGSGELAHQESMAAAATASTSSFTVTTLLDNGPGSLRQAIADANASPGPDTIVFEPVLFTSPKVITLTSGELVIRESLTINGPGQTNLTISGNKASRVFNIESAADDVAFNNLTIAHGQRTSEAARGGGILNWSKRTLILNNILLSENSAQAISTDVLVAQGGGIFNGTAALALVSSRVSNNSAVGDIFGSGEGGGIWSAGPVSLIDTSLSDNSAEGPEGGYGGGIHSLGELEMVNCRLFRNSVKGVVGQGGGLLQAGLRVTITASTISGNSAQASSAKGGGIYVSHGILTVISTSMSGNSCTGSGISSAQGGAIYSDLNALVAITNSTLSGNSARVVLPALTHDDLGLGGAIYTRVWAHFILNNDTVVDNKAEGGGGGIFVENNGSESRFEVRNTILAHNSSPLGPDANAEVVSQGNNLVGDGSGSSGFTRPGDQVGTSSSPINALLGSLSSNGGPTQTHALLPGSPAINAGNNCVIQSPGCIATPLSNDQRGAGFSRRSGTTVDIGAFEVQVTGAGPGFVPDTAAGVSGDNGGSLLIFNVYTSSPAAPARQNTRITLTNTDPTRGIAVHLFFVDGSSCSVADRYICLSPSQTTSLLASEQDPGTTGYLVAVAVDSRIGCPISFNNLIGEELVKFESGHVANLRSESIPELAGILPVCDENAVSAFISLNGINYGRVGAVLATSSITSRADGNSTMLIVNRISGNLMASAGSIGALFGTLYDEAEAPHSFSASDPCQLRRILDDNYPRTTPRLETVIPSGTTGWIKLWGQTGGPLFGAQINFNPQATLDAGAFNQGHNLHKLKLANSGFFIIPIFPPQC